MDAARIERDPDRSIPRPTRDALEQLRRLVLPARSRVLVACEGADAVRDLLRREGLEPATAPDLATLDLPPRSFDAALIAGRLERTEWDRWALQQVHRLLVPGAPLVLAVPNLAAPATLAEPAFAAGLVRKRLTGLLRRALRVPPLPPPPFTRRKYRIRALVHVLERLGYRVTDVRAAGARSSEPEPAGLKPGHAFVPGWTLVARTEGSLYGGAGGRPWPDPAAFRARFEREHHA